MALRIRDAQERDLPAVRQLLTTVFGAGYADPDVHGEDWLRRCLYSEREELLVANEGRNVVGFASLSTGARDLVAKFGRLVVHPEHSDPRVADRLMERRIERCRGSIHVGWTEARVADPIALRVVEEHGFEPVGFEPSKYDLGSAREAAVVYLRLFAEARELQRRTPRVVPEVYPLATTALGHLELDVHDVEIARDETGYVADPAVETEEFDERPYAQRFEVERAKLRGGPAVAVGSPTVGFLHQPWSRARYLVALRDGAFAGTIGILEDPVDRRARILELLGTDEGAKGTLLDRASERVRNDLGAAYVEIDVAATDAPIQRTLIRRGYVPVAYLPGLARSGLERLDVVRMAHAPGDDDGIEVPSLRPAAESIRGSWPPPSRTDACRRRWWRRRERWRSSGGWTERRSTSWPGCAGSRPSRRATPSCRRERRRGACSSSWRASSTCSTRVRSAAASSARSSRERSSARWRWWRRLRGRRPSCAASRPGWWPSRWSRSSDSSSASRGWA